MSARPVVGGPLDGLLASDAGSVSFAWLGRRQTRPDFAVRFAKPGARRLLYRRVDGAWLFAGDTHRVCGGCGALVRNPEAGRERAPCGLCGGT